MRTITITIYAAAVIFLLAGCEQMGTLHPANAEARANGALTAHFTSASTGSGDMVVMMPGGETLHGSYGAGAPSAFGEVFGAVYGGPLYQIGYVNLSRTGTQTTANLSGGKGLSMKCEFYNDDDTNHGFGACRSSTGALYSLQY